MNKDKILVGVYGTLKRGFYNHHLLEKAEFIKTTVIPDGNYCLYDLGSFPAVKVVLYGNEETTPVTVEIFQVDKETFDNLDRLEGYPSFYNRVLIETPEGYHAWLYVMSSEQLSYHKGKSIIPDGNYK